MGYKYISSCALILSCLLNLRLTLAMIISIIVVLILMGGVNTEKVNKEDINHFLGDKMSEVKEEINIIIMTVCAFMLLVVGLYNVIMTLN